MPLRRWLKRPRPMTVWAIIFTGLTFYAIGGNRQRAMEGQEAHDALCVLRASAARQLATNEGYLKQKGDPIVIFGLKVPRATLESSVTGQRRTVRSLSNLDC